MRRLVFAVVIVALWYGSVAAGQSIVVAPAARGADDVSLGVIVDTTDPRSMRLAREAGFTHAKMIIHWPRLEPRRGRFAWQETPENDLDNVVNAARGEGMRLVVRVDGVPDWAGGSPAKADRDAVRSFYEAMAAHGKGVIVGYEILNEPNLPVEWGGAPSPAGYATFLEAAHRGIRASDPAAVVIGGGASPNTGGLGGTIEDVDFLRGIYAAGARGSMDALAVHNYGGSSEPERDPGECGICFRRAELYRRIMVEQGDAQTPIWSTEFGWLHDAGRDLGQYDWMKVSADRQADYILRAVRYGRANWPWLGGLLLSNLDASTTPYHTGPQDGLPWFAILNKDYSPRPAYEAFKRMREQDAAAARPALTPEPTPAQSPEPTPGQSPEPTPGQSPEPTPGPPMLIAARPLIDPASPAPVGRSVATPTPPAAAPAERLRVVGTGRDGVSLRAGPSTTARRVKVLAEGTGVDVIGPDRTTEGRPWRNVREFGGADGWVAAEYLAP